MRINGGHYPTGTLDYHFPQPGSKHIKVKKNQTWKNGEKGYIVQGYPYLETNGYSFVDYKAQNPREFGFLDYEAHVNLKLNFVFNNVYGELQDLENNFSHLLCIKKQTQLLTNLALSIKDPLLSG